MIENELYWTPQMVARFWANEHRHPENYFSYQVGRVIAKRFGKYLRGSVLDICPGGWHLGQELNFLYCPVELGAPLLGMTFDAAVMLEVIEHLYRPELDNAFSMARRALKPGGYLIITTPNNEDRSLSMLTSPESGKRYHRWQHVRSCDLESLNLEIQNQKFKLIESGVTDFGRSIHAHYRYRSLPRRLLTALVKTALRKTPHLYAVAQCTS